MRKTIAFALSLLAISTPAFAQVGYRSTNGYYYINKLFSGKLYRVDLGGMPLIRNRIANKCGILEFKPSTNELSNLPKIEIVDGQTQQTYGFDFKNLAARETPTCSGQVVTDHAVWLSSKGYIGISGLTPSSSEKIRFLSSTSYRNLKANRCGFLSFQLDTVVPSAFIVNGLAYPTSGTPGQGIYCKQGILYVSYPPPTPINPVDATTWTQSNPRTQAFSSNTIVISSSGSSGSNSSSSTTSGGTTTTVGGTSSSGGGSTSTSRGGTTVAVTPPTGGGSSNGGTISGGGTTSSGGGTTSSGGGTTNSKPQPPTGQKMCKVGTQLVSVVPKKNVLYYAATEEDQSYEEENSDNTGYIVFNNINFTDTSNNGGLSDIEIGEIDLTKPSFANRKPLGGGWTVNISVVQPCK